MRDAEHGADPHRRLGHDGPAGNLGPARTDPVADPAEFIVGDFAGIMVRTAVPVGNVLLGATWVGIAEAAAAPPTPRCEPMPGAAVPQTRVPRRR